MDLIDLRIVCRSFSTTGYNAYSGKAFFLNNSIVENSQMIPVSRDCSYNPIDIAFALYSPNGQGIIFRLEIEESISLDLTLRQPCYIWNPSASSRCS